MHDGSGSLDNNALRSEDEHLNKNIKAITTYLENVFELTLIYSSTSIQNRTWIITTKIGYLNIIYQNVKYNQFKSQLNNKILKR